jgi:hypothetical protein
MSATTWKSYEDLAVALLSQWAEEFGFEKVEQGGKTTGLRSGTGYALDGKAFRRGKEGFLIVECRRYSTTKQKQEQVGALAYRIIDTGAAGGLLVSPLGLQKGAELVASAERIEPVLLDQNSTTIDHVIRWMNKTFLSTSVPIGPLFGDPRDTTRIVICGTFVDPVDPTL